MVGLDTDALAERHPGLVVGSLSAWGSTGPWGGRRGFDSIVQAACGIAMLESPDGDRPGALPCQLLDHGTGYLAAAAAIEAALTGLGIQHFYDDNQQIALWGTNQVETLQRVYLEDSSSVVMFISREYAAKVWPIAERRATLSRACANDGSTCSRSASTTRSCQAWTRT